jgi:hypothetical protein
MRKRDNLLTGGGEGWGGGRRGDKSYDCILRYNKNPSAKGTEELKSFEALRKFQLYLIKNHREK